MKSAMLLAPLLAAALLVTGCAGSTRLLAPAEGCSALIPAGWSKAIPSALAPAEDGDETDWQVFGIEQTGQLAKANGRTADVIEVVTACEARDAAAARHINAPFWAFWR